MGARAAVTTAGVGTKGEVVATCNWSKREERYCKHCIISSLQALLIAVLKRWIERDNK